MRRVRTSPRALKSTSRCVRALARAGVLAGLILFAFVPRAGAIASSYLQPEYTAEQALFGAALAIDGDLVIGGAPGDSDTASRAGAAFVYQRRGRDWDRIARLRPAGLDANDDYGSYVDVRGDLAIVAAPGDDDLGTNTGAAYIFRFASGAWSEETKLLPTNPVNFTRAGVVAIDADVALFRSGNVVHVFRYAAGVWALEQLLSAPDAPLGGGFGSGVDVRGDRIVVGANLDDESGVDAGAAYAFIWNGASWNLEQKLVPIDARAGLQFGAKPQVDGTSMVISSMDAGYAFVFDGLAWSQQQRIPPPDSGSTINFPPMGISGDRLVFGDRTSNADPAYGQRGGAWIFERTAGTWSVSLAVGIGDLACPCETRRLGQAVAISGPFAVAGSWDSLGPGGESQDGAAWVIALDDPDDDGLPSQLDNCPLASNADQLDENADGVGDACDPLCSEPGALDLDALVEPLRVDRRGGASVTVTWGPLAGRRVNVYQGALGSLHSVGTYSHADVGACAVGLERVDLPMPTPDTYWLACSRCSGRDGSLGRDSLGTERPAASPGCP